MIGAGDFITMDPSGRSLVVSAEESPRLRLFRVFLDGRPEQEISTDGSAPIMNFGRPPGRPERGRPASGAAHGRLVQSSGYARSCHRTHHPPASDDSSDFNGMVWLADGQIMALHIGLSSTLWRFYPTAPSR